LHFRRFLRHAAALLLASAAYAVCAIPARADTVQVAVAANLQFVFDELRDAFRKDSGHDVQATYNSSGKFVAQITNGAPFDVFMSADMEYPEKLHAAGLTVEAPKVYASGALVLWTLKEIDLDHWQAALTNASVAKIAVANPQTAPYGREAIHAFEYFYLVDRIRQKLVFGESIAQTNQYIYSKAADIGITAKSTVLAPGMKGQGKWIDLPHESYRPIAQGVVILQHGERLHREASHRFLAFLQSAAARSIFERYGYVLP
jgi:molybdate transport system substrate-binding protein